MNPDIQASVYRENAELKRRLDDYRKLIADVLEDGVLPEELAGTIRARQQAVEKKRT